MSIISCTSPSPSERILPTSRRDQPAERLLVPAQLLAELARTTSPRRGAGHSRQAANASTAAAATRS